MEDISHNFFLSKIRFPNVVKMELPSELVMWTFAIGVPIEDVSNAWLNNTYWSGSLSLIFPTFHYFFNILKVVTVIPVLVAAATKFFATKNSLKFGTYAALIIGRLLKIGINSRR